MFCSNQSRAAVLSRGAQISSGNRSEIAGPPLPGQPRSSADSNSSSSFATAVLCVLLLLASDQGSKADLPNTEGSVIAFQEPLSCYLHL